MDEELGAGLRRVTRSAEVEARRLSQGYIGVEHLLLALLADDDSVAAQALASLDVSVELTRERVGRISAPARSGTLPTGQFELTPRAEQVLAMAQHNLDRAADHDHHREHLLLAILDEGESVAVQMLKEQLGDDLGIAVERVLELAGEPQVDPEAVSCPRPPRRIEQPEPLRCSFCGKWQSQVERLIAGPGVYICNECVDLCVEILDNG